MPSPSCCSPIRAVRIKRRRRQTDDTDSAAGVGFGKRSQFSSRTHRRRGRNRLHVAGISTALIPIGRRLPRHWRHSTGEGSSRCSQRRREKTQSIGWCMSWRRIFQSRSWFVGYDDRGVVASHHFKPKGTIPNEEFGARSGEFRRCLLIFRSLSRGRASQTNKHKEQLVASLKTEVDSLRSDNVKLYEKIKFLQGYQSSVYIYAVSFWFFK